MNFQITISGEGPELGNAIKTLREVMDGKIAEGSVTASIQPGQAPQAPVSVPTIPAQAAQAYQQQQAYTPPAIDPSQPFAQGQQPLPTQPAPGAVPTGGAPTYTMEQLGVAAGPLVDTGRGPELTAWLQQKGAGALTQLPKEHYGEFATFLRGLGAKI